MLPLAPRIASLMKRWLMGTFQGAVREQHLDYYLDEYIFHFNRRAYTSRGKLFYQHIQQAMVIESVPANLIIGETEELQKTVDSEKKREPQNMRCARDNCVPLKINLDTSILSIENPGGDIHQGVVFYYFNVRISTVKTQDGRHPHP